MTAVITFIAYTILVGAGFAMPMVISAGHHRRTKRTREPPHRNPSGVADRRNRASEPRP